MLLKDTEKPWILLHCRPSLPTSFPTAAGMSQVCHSLVLDLTFGNTLAHNHWVLDGHVFEWTLNLLPCSDGDV